MTLTVDVVAPLLTLLGLIVLGVAVPGLGRGIFHRLDRTLGRASRHFATALAAVGLFATLVAAAVSVLAWFPVPRYHDEFSYLLATDTFLHGRLANPTHPRWQHFETFHVLHRPTYSSKYPPAQGALLALGALLGHPLAGVWLSAGLAAAAVSWMLAAWLPRRWAILGATLLIFHPTILEWSQWYMVGLVPLAAGALLLGVVPRAARHPCAGHGLIAGVAMAILANSRPYEGLLLTTAATVGGLILARNLSTPASLLLRRIALPAALVLLPVFAWMAFYNYRVVGHPLRLPYQEHMRQYVPVPVFLWSRPAPVPPSRHPALRDFYSEWAAESYRAHGTAAGVVAEAAERMVQLTEASLRLAKHQGYAKVLPSVIQKLREYFSYALVVPLLMIPWVVRRVVMKVALLIVILCLLGTLAIAWVLPHYAAPWASVVLIFVLAGLRQLRVARAGRRRFGTVLVLAVLSVWVISGVICMVQFSGGYTREFALAPVRVAMERRLRSEPQPDLVIVKQSTFSHFDFVYNAADIDAAPVVWARDMGEDANRPLRKYFANRKVWRLDADAHLPRLSANGENP